MGLCKTFKISTSSHFYIYWSILDSFVFLVFVVNVRFFSSYLAIFTEWCQASSTILNRIWNLFLNKVKKSKISILFLIGPFRWLIQTIKHTLNIDLNTHNIKFMASFTKHLRNLIWKVRCVCLFVRFKMVCRFCCFLFFQHQHCYLFVKCMLIASNEIHSMKFHELILFELWLDFKNVSESAPQMNFLLY